MQEPNESQDEPGPLTLTDIIQIYLGFWYFMLPIYQQQESLMAEYNIQPLTFLPNPPPIFPMETVYAQHVQSFFINMMMAAEQNPDGPEHQILYPGLDHNSVPNVNLFAQPQTHNEFQSVPQEFHNYRLDREFNFNVFDAFMDDDNNGGNGDDNVVEIVEPSSSDSFLPNLMEQGEAGGEPCHVQPGEPGTYQLFPPEPHPLYAEGGLFAVYQQRHEEYQRRLHQPRPQPTPSYSQEFVPLSEVPIPLEFLPEVLGTETEPPMYTVHRDSTGAFITRTNIDYYHDRPLFSTNRLPTAQRSRFQRNRASSNRANRPNVVQSAPCIPSSNSRSRFNGMPPPGFHPVPLFACPSFSQADRRSSAQRRRQQDNVQVAGTSGYVPRYQRQRLPLDQRAVRRPTSIELAERLERQTLSETLGPLQPEPQQQMPPRLPPAQPQQMQSTIYRSLPQQIPQSLNHAQPQRLPHTMPQQMHYQDNLVPNEHPSPNFSQAPFLHQQLYCQYEVVEQQVFASPSVTNIPMSYQQASEHYPVPCPEFVNQFGNVSPDQFFNFLCENASRNEVITQFMNLSITPEQFFNLPPINTCYEQPLNSQSQMFYNNMQPHCSSQNLNEDVRRTQSCPDYYSSAAPSTGRFSNNGVLIRHLILCYILARTAYFEGNVINDGEISISEPSSSSSIPSSSSNEPCENVPSLEPEVPENQSQSTPFGDEYLPHRRFPANWHLSLSQPHVHHPYMRHQPQRSVHTSRHSSPDCETTTPTPFTPNQPSQPRGAGQNPAPRAGPSASSSTARPSPQGSTQNPTTPSTSSSPVEAHHNPEELLSIPIFLGDGMRRPRIIRATREILTNFFIMPTLVELPTPPPSPSSSSSTSLAESQPDLAQPSNTQNSSVTSVSLEASPQGPVQPSSETQIETLSTSSEPPCDADFESLFANWALFDQEDYDSWPSHERKLFER